MTCKTLANCLAHFIQSLFPTKDLFLVTHSHIFPFRAYSNTIKTRRFERSSKCSSELNLEEVVDESGSESGIWSVGDGGGEDEEEDKGEEISESGSEIEGKIGDGDRDGVIVVKMGMEVEGLDCTDKMV